MSDFLDNLPLAFALVMGALMIFGGLIVTVAGLMTLTRWLTSARWIQVPAQIVSCEVRKTERLDEKEVYSIRVNYTFAVGGGMVTGRRTALVEKLFSSEAAAGKAASRYVAGLVVPAFYPPDQPEEAVLERRGALAGLIVLLLGLGMIGGPLAAGKAHGMPMEWVGGGLAALVTLGGLLLWLTGRRLKGARRQGLYPAPGLGRDENVEELVRRGEKMLAMRLYREIHGCDLKTSRLRVETIAERLRRSG